MKNFFKSGSCGNTAKKFIYMGETMGNNENVSTETGAVDYSKPVKEHDHPVDSFDKDVDQDFMAQIENQNKYPPYAESARGIINFVYKWSETDNSNVPSLISVEGMDKKIMNLTAQNEGNVLKIEYRDDDTGEMVKYEINMSDNSFLRNRKSLEEREKGGYETREELIENANENLFRVFDYIKSGKVINRSGNEKIPEPKKIEKYDPWEEFNEMSNIISKNGSYRFSGSKKLTIEDPEFGEMKYITINGGTEIIVEIKGDKHRFTVEEGAIIEEKNNSGKKVKQGWGSGDFQFFLKRL